MRKNKRFHTIVERNTMLKTIITFLLIIIPSVSFADNKTKELLTLAVMAGIDYSQSKENIKKGHIEINPLLGENPSNKEMAIFGIVCIGATYGVMNTMPEGKLKNFVMDSILATEQLNIEENRNVKQYGHRTFPKTLMIVLSFKF